MARLAKARVFTRLDIRHAFNRIRMHPDSEDLTTFRTRYGSYKYKVLPFGLCNGPSSLPADPAEHEGHVRKVLQRLREAGLPADIKKSEFGVTETKFLGFIVTTQGIRMDPTKVEVIQDWPVPTTLKQLQSFLGFCNYYRAFLKDHGRVTRPLSLLTKKDGFCPLGPKEIEAFERAKALILSGGLLAHYSPFRESRMEMDASDGITAGVLSQLQDDGHWHPIASCSKTMCPAEMRYEIHDKEMLAVMRGLNEWRGLLNTSPLSGSSTPDRPGGQKT